MKLINDIELSTHELGLLVKDAELINDGYKIHYVVDAYDVIEYCFPKGIDGDKELELNKHEKNLMGYHYLFNEVNSDNRPIILDEYLGEINRNRIKFINNKIRRNYLRDSVYELKLKDVDFANLKEADQYKNIVNDIQYLISSAIFNDDSIKTFTELMSEKVLYQRPFSFEHNKEAEAVYNAFQKSTEGVSKAVSAFEKWLNSNLQLFNGKTPSELSYLLETTMRDFKAIERICNANKIIQNHENPHFRKNIFLYFSNSGRSKSIVNSDVFNIWYKDNAILNEPNYSMWRNINDVVILFLLNINLNNDTQSKNLTILNNLRELHELSKLNDQSKNKQEIEWRIDLKQLEILAFTNETLSSKLYLNQKFKEKAELAIKNLDSKLNIKAPKFNLNSVFDKETIDGIKSAEGNISKLQSFKNLHETISIQNTLWDFLSHVNTKSEGIKNEPGSDFITGTFHKLPILLFHNKIFHGRNKRNFPFEVYDNVLKNLLKSQTNTELENETFLDNVKKILSYKNKHEDFEVDDKMIMIFMMMLVIPEENIDQRVLIELESLPSILENIYLNSKLEENKLKVYRANSFKERNSYIEYLYFKAWILRRCSEYELSKKICLEGKERYPKQNARFIHGLALVEFCEYRNNRKVANKTSRDVKSIMKKINQAINAYESQTKDENDWLIQGTIMSLQNMLTYLLVQDSFNKILLSKNNDFSFIDSNLNVIFEIRKNFKDSYDSHFEIMFTSKLINILMEIKNYVGKIKDIKRIRVDLEAYLKKENKLDNREFDLEIIDLIIELLRSKK